METIKFQVEFLEYSMRRFKTHQRYLTNKSLAAINTMETIKFQVEFLVDEINRENSTEIQRRYLTSQSLAALKRAAEEFKERNRFVRDIKIKLS